MFRTNCFEQKTKIYFSENELFRHFKCSCRWFSWNFFTFPLFFFLFAFGLFLSFGLQSHWFLHHNPKNAIWIRFFDQNVPIDFNADIPMLNFFVSFLFKSFYNIFNFPFFRNANFLLKVLKIDFQNDFMNLFDRIIKFENIAKIVESNVTQDHIRISSFWMLSLDRE